MSAIATGIKAHRIRQRYSQQSLADALGWQRGRVQRIEAGKIEPTVDEALELAAFFRVPLSDLIGQGIGTVPSYHDLYITTRELHRRSISDLPYGYEVTCTRVGGWKLWRNGTHVAGEYDDNGLRLDVAGHVIVDSLSNQEKWIDQR